MVAFVGPTDMAMPVMIVTVAVCTIEVSACDVAEMVAVGVMTAVPLVVTVGRVLGAV